MEFVPNEKATPIRYPSTANLMVDSADRDLLIYETCSNFLITKKQSIMNGFFTRVGTTEVVMEWFSGNIGGSTGQFVYTVGATAYDFSLAGFFTVADLLNDIVSNLNEFTPSTGLTWTVAAVQGGGANLTATGAPAIVFSVASPALVGLIQEPSLGATIPAGGSEIFPIEPVEADLRPTRYLDIVCTQLTNNQAVKDASTAENTRDVLCRWYFDYDNQSALDAYGFPILMGYTPFCIRRIFNPPKQIQWQSNVPIGQMAFQLYDDRGEEAIVNINTNFLMTLQASEV